MYFLPIPREQLLRFLPQGGVVAEIGVAEAQFSQYILRDAAPAKLHLIDPWDFQTGAYTDDINNVSQSEQQARYENVVKTLEGEIATGRVTVHRDYSENVVDSFENGYFDWVYVDAMHTYEGVKADLCAFDSKVKADGFILGDDYTNHPSAQSMNFGVIEAVNEFVRQTGYEFMFLTADAYPSYFLAKNADTDIFRSILGPLLVNVPGIVEVRDFTDRQFVHKVIKLNDEHYRYLPSV